MVSFYKTVDLKIIEIDEPEMGCWVNMVAPTEAEIIQISQLLSIEMDFLRAALDIEETSRIESEDGQTLIVIDMPTAEKHEEAVVFETIPLSIIVTNDYIITVSVKETSVIRGFCDGVVKNVCTNLKTRFILQLLYRVATRFLFYLKQIDKMSNYIEKQLHKSMKNKELFQLLDLEKSLVFFTTSLSANHVTLEKLRRGKFVKLYEDDEELLEDVIIEIKQAIEMSNIYSSILSGMMDAFASVISNNLNIVMKVLTSLTILLAVPTMIASFYGMNVDGLPVPHFWFVIAVSVAITGGATYILTKKNML